jgi:hypothetical protein
MVINNMNRDASADHALLKAKDIFRRIAVA